MPRSTRRGEGTLADIAGRGGRILDPVACVVCLRRSCDTGKRRIEQIVVERCRIDHEESPRIGIYPALHGQIHQNRAGQRVLERQRRQASELPAPVIEQKQHDLFGESQHALTLPTRGHELPSRPGISACDAAAVQLAGMHCDDCPASVARGLGRPSATPVRHRAPRRRRRRGPPPHAGTRRVRSHGRRPSPAPALVSLV